MRLNARTLLRRRLRMRQTYALPKQKEKNEAVIKIQRWYKMRQWKRRPRKSIGSSAILIQKLWRGKRGRQIAAAEREELKNMAASVIQEIYRKYREDRRIRLEAQMTECPICMERVGVFNSLELGCGHKVCNACVRDLIEHSVANAQTDIPIKCPFFSEDCEEIFSCFFPNAFSLCSQETYRKWERWEIMKTHIPVESIAYCPYPECGMPYDASLFGDISSNAPVTPSNMYKYRVLCPECMSLFCVKCKDVWESNHVCRTVTQILTNAVGGSSADEESSKYLQQRCKQCPNCNAVVQKRQTNDQVTYEERYGLSGGTEDCHHMTCSNCKHDFCWTCLKGYRGSVYYHSTCPISDCVITFRGDIPRIIRVPLCVNLIRVEVVNNDRMDVPNVTWYNTNGMRSVTHTEHRAPEDSSVFLTCDADGVVLSLRGRSGEFTFRQENKRDNSAASTLPETRPRSLSENISGMEQSSTLMGINNRYRNLAVNTGLDAVLANNRIVQGPVQGPLPNRGRIDLPNRTRSHSTPTNRQANIEHVTRLEVPGRITNTVIRDTSLNNVRYPRLPAQPEVPPQHRARNPRNLTPPPIPNRNPPRTAAELLNQFNRRHI